MGGEGGQEGQVQGVRARQGQGRWHRLGVEGCGAVVGLRVLLGSIRETDRTTEAVERCGEGHHRKGM